MAFEGHGAFPLTAAGILGGAPQESGVYAIHTPTRWVFIGDADNLRQALFDHLNARDEPVESFQPLSFSWEAATPAERRGLRDALITELRPACNARSRSDRVPPRRYEPLRSDRPHLLRPLRGAGVAGAGRRS